MKNADPCVRFARFRVSRVMSRAWERWLGAATLAFVAATIVLFIAERFRAPQPDPVSLKVQWQGGRIKIDFNPNHPAVANSESGILRVRDGARSFEYKIDRRILASGGFDYQPGSNDVLLTLLLPHEGGTQAHIALRAIAAVTPSDSTAGAR